LSLTIVRSDYGQEVFTQAVQGKSICATGYESSKALRSAGDKRANLSARMKLNKLVGKSVPEYCEKAPKASLLAYPYYLVVYFNAWVSSKGVLYKLTGALLNAEIAVMGIIRFLMKRFA
jgi:hypothetical protein